MAYKKLIKVSNVCQLLDKRKYNPSQTINGVTFTNNGDGTITVNGTATANTIYILTTFETATKVTVNHKYLYTYNVPNGSNLTYYSDLKTIPGDTTVVGIQNGYVFYTATGNDTAVRVNIRVFAGYTADNLVFKPQLFDLTEMYGAGHEPTTVEEFRQDFPEEMYDYSPHCWATSYSRRLKVSNVCQLLDKRKYPATTTKEGITWTNNGDGTITANGTATAFTNILVDTVTPTIIKSGHKFLMLGCPLSNGNITTSKEYWMQEGYEFASDHGNGNIFTIKGNNINLRIYIQKDYTANNLTFKPQIFDLTEMYGAGNEPTSVEQFRQDFPEEIYDYSPSCYLTSYQRNLTCKTKNLFDISKVTETDDLKVIGNSIYSYHYPAISDDTSTLSIFKSLKPNTNYTMQAVCPYYLGNATNAIRLIFNNGSDFELFYNHNSGFAQKTFSLTQEQIDNIRFVYFYGKLESEGGPIIWSNIQIEEGSTATGYVPYGHL